MSEQKIAPVLTDEEIAGYFEDGRWSFDPMHLPVARAIEQAVLAKQGAVRDQAREEAAVAAERVGRPAGASDGTTYICGTSIEAAHAIRALKGTPVAAVAQPDARSGLRKLVDRVWNEATESTAVPDTPWADRLIADVFGELPQLSGNPGQVADAEPVAWRWAWPGYAWTYDDRRAPDVQPGKIIEPLFAAQPSAQAQPSGNAALDMERALAELVDKIVPGLDTGDLVADAIAASKAMDAQPSGNAGELERDAERYRLLRRKVCIVGDKFHLLNLHPTYVAPDAAVELDAALSAAIAASKGAKP